jgi:hypothetical protein
MQVRKLWKRRNQAILTWPGEEPLGLAYNAYRIVVPPRDVISRPARGAPWTHPAAELNGKPLAGTALIEDVISLTAEGGYRTTLDIDAVCHYLTTQRDDLFTQGFNVVETADQVAEALALGLPLYEESQDNRARDILSRELQRQKAYKDRGEQPPPAISQHLIAWAMKHLQRRPAQTAAVRMEDIQSALGGAAPPASGPAPAPEPVAAPAPASAAPSDDVNAMSVTELFALASKLHVSVPTLEMAGLLRGSPEVIEKVKLKIKDKLVQLQVQDAAARAEEGAVAS